jgi:hypothetical protein
VRTYNSERGGVGEGEDARSSDDEGLRDDGEDGGNDDEDE